MACLIITKVMEIVLILFLTVIAATAPLDAGLLCHTPPNDYFSGIVDLESLYRVKFGGYLAAHKPGFLVAVVWLEVAFLWPLAVVNLYGLLCGTRPWWFRTTALVFGVSYCTAMIAVASELKWSSHQVPQRLLMGYLAFIFCGLLVILRGLLLPCCPESAISTIGNRPRLSGFESKKKT